MTIIKIIIIFFLRIKTKKFCSWLAFIKKKKKEKRDSDKNNFSQKKKIIFLKI